MPGWITALLIVAVVWAGLVVALVIAGRGSAARELALLLPNLVSLFRGLLRDRRVPRTSKALLWIALVWVLSPIDLVPEFIPIAGPLDDAIVAALVLRQVIRKAGVDVVAEHWNGSARTLSIILRIAGVVRSR